MLKLFNNLAKNCYKKTMENVSCRCSNNFFHEFHTQHNNLLDTNLSSRKKRKKLVILGTGWGSYSVLKYVDKRIYDVTVISPRNYFLFTPLLCSTTVGTLEFRSIIEPVRSIYSETLSGFHMASAVSLNTETRTLHCKSEIDKNLFYDLTYDKLVIGVGAKCNTFGLPGVQENAFFLKELDDAKQIRRQLINNFELATHPSTSELEQNRLLHIVIVGGGPTGVEFGAEVYDFLREDVARLYRGLQNKVKVTLIEADKILNSFDKRLREYAETKIQKRKQFELLKVSVQKLEDNAVVLNSGKIIPCGIVVWSTGLSPRTFTRDVQLDKDKHGRILVDCKLRVVNTPVDSVYALGDCSNIDTMPLPSTAQVAERQGRWLAQYLNGTTEKPFEFENLGMLAYVGGYSALSDLKPSLLKLTGFTSWVLWRSAYLTRLGNWKLRLQVPVDWTKAFLFGRDTSQI